MPLSLINSKNIEADELVVNNIQVKDADFSGTVGGVTKSMVGLGSVDNTSDANKPVSNAAQATLNDKAPLASPIFTGTVQGITKSMVGLGNVENTSDANKQISNATQTALSAKAPLESPTFTGTVGGITKTMVGLGSVDNTSDENKPISSATSTALNEKAPKASPTFTGTVSGITKSMVGLGSVDNTSDENKPISSATSTALNNKADKAGTTFTGTVVAPSITLGTSDLQATLNDKADKAGTTFTGTVVAPSITTPAITLNGSNLGTKLTDLQDQIFARQSQIQSFEYSDSSYNTTLGNQTRLSTVGDVFRIQHFDNDGTVATDGWQDMLKVTWNTNNNTSLVTVDTLTHNNNTADELTVIGDLAVSEDLVVDSIKTNYANELTIKDNMVIGSNALNNNLTVYGNLSISGFYPHKPYVAFYFTAGAISSSNVPGFVPRVNITMDPRNNNELYAFTFSPAHPNGTNYMVMVTARTGSSSTYFYCTANATANNRFLVWCRTSPNALVNGEYYVQTIP